MRPGSKVKTKPTRWRFDNSKGSLNTLLGPFCSGDAVSLKNSKAARHGAQIMQLRF